MIINSYQIIVMSVQGEQMPASILCWYLCQISQQTLQSVMESMPRQVRDVLAESGGGGGGRGSPHSTRQVVRLIGLKHNKKYLERMCSLFRYSHNSLSIRNNGSVLCITVEILGILVLLLLLMSKQWRTLNLILLFIVETKQSIWDSSAGSKVFG